MLDTQMIILIGIVSIAVTCLGLAFLVDLYFFHTSSYANHAVALLLCGVISPSIQSMDFIKKEKSNKFDKEEKVCQ